MTIDQPLLVTEEVGEGRQCTMMAENRERAWDDLCCDLLTSIYSKLPSNYPPCLGFGAVCKNWNQIHAAAPKSGSPQPDSTLVGSYRFRVGNRPGPTLEPGWGRIPTSTRGRFKYSKIQYIWQSGWWLLSHGGDAIDGCFNPFLLWPTCFIALPDLMRFPPLLEAVKRPLPPVTAAAFSASPDSPDWTLLVVHTRHSFSTVRPGQRRWRSYVHTRSGEGREAVRIGYRRGKFYILFETGDVLIFWIEGSGGEQMMQLIADPPLPSGELGRRTVLRVVGESIAVVWERSVGGEGRFRLMRVERRTTPEVEAEEGRSRGGAADLAAREEADVKIKRDWTAAIMIGLIYAFMLIFLLGALAPLLLLRFGKL